MYYLYLYFICSRDVSLQCVAVGVCVIDDDTAKKFFLEEIRCFIVLTLRAIPQKYCINQVLEFVGKSELRNVVGPHLCSCIVSEISDLSTCPIRLFLLFLILLYRALRSDIVSNTPSLVTISVRLISRFLP